MMDKKEDHQYERRLKSLELLFQDLNNNLSNMDAALSRAFRVLVEDKIKKFKREVFEEMYANEDKIMGYCEAYKEEVQEFIKKNTKKVKKNTKNKKAKKCT